MARIIHTTGLEISGSQFTQISNDLTASFNITGSGDVIGGQFIIDKGAATGSSFQVLSDGQLLIANKGGGQINKISLKALEIDDSNSNSTSFRLGGPIRVGQGTADSINHQHEMSGSVNITGSMNAIGVNIMSSSRIDPKITSILTENDSFPFIQNVTTTGPNFRMNLVDEGSGKAYISLGNQAGGFAGTGFNAHYATGSNASEGEIIMSIGKNGSAGALEDRFIVQSEPGPIASNTDSELSLVVGGPITGRRNVLGTVTTGTGEFATFSAGIDKQFGRKRYVEFEFSAAGTSSRAGFHSSSLNGTGVPNFNTNTIPFGIDAGQELTDTSFFIDRGGSLGASQPVTASLQISRGGHINMEGSLSASGNITASGFLFISASENAAQGYRVLVHDRVSGRVYATGSYVGTVSPYVTGSGPGDIQTRIGSNSASGSFSTVGGGQFNKAFGHNNFIAGGSGSIAKGTNNVVLGGQFNSISGSTKHSVIAGSNNVIDTTSGGSSIVTGLSNTLTGLLADGIVITGQGNSSLSKGSVIFGKNNTISGEAYYYHVGGIGNTISGTEQLQNNPGAIMGGGSNTLGLPHIGQGQIIVGGLSNTIAGYTGNSTILQGQNNIIDDALQPTQQFNKTYLLILNGEGNQITGSALANTGVGAKDKSGKFSTIVNGEANRIETGGTGTDTFYKYNTIMNGSNNFVSGSGVTAGVSGMYNTIVNGDNNIIGPDISGSTIAAGSNIKADRSDTVFAANLSLTNLPTSDTGLPVGAVYRDGNTLKIVT
jgi:hypothetical protein